MIVGVGCDCVDFKRMVRIMGRFDCNLQKSLPQLLVPGLKQSCCQQARGKRINIYINTLFGSLYVIYNVWQAFLSWRKTSIKLLWLQCERNIAEPNHNSA